MTNSLEQPRFLSLKWKSLITLASVLVMLLVVLAWFYYQSFQKSLHNALITSRQQQINAVERLINRDGESLLRMARSFIVSASISETTAPQQTQAVVQAINAHYEGLHRQWQIDELVLLDTTQQIKHRMSETTLEASWLKEWIVNTANVHLSSPVSIECTAQCRQVIILPMFKFNALVGTVVLTRDIDLLSAQLLEESSAYLSIAIEKTDSNNGTDMPGWDSVIFADGLPSSVRTAIQKIADEFDANTIMGMSAVTRLPATKQRFSVTAMPIRGASSENARFILAREITEPYSQLLKSVWQQLAIVGAVLCLFMIYLMAVSWRHLGRIRQQIAVLPLLGEKQFQKAREIISQNRAKLFFDDERDTLDDVVNSLSYQLESLEKAVSVRTKEMERLSLFDTLTGLANRNLFLYELQSDVDNYDQSEGLLAAVILDLDKFKRINDTISHQHGDELLCRIGMRLKNATKSLGLVARLGGDEFAIILRGAKKYHQVELLCEKIIDLIHKPIELENEQIVISCSLGIALATENLSSDDLVKNAEIAMYNAKDAGGNCYRLFNQSMASRAHANLSLEADLRRAFEQKEFTLYLQPKVAMDSTIMGFESLIRWDHPKRGLMAPVEFIPAMENMGLISRLDNFVLDASCRQLKVLQTHYPDISIAVNISSVHFTDEAFLTFLKECLERYPINPAQLELEITETLLMENMSTGMEIINKIKELGVSIAIDDFGTGYSSLSYLKKLPVDTIKIDREFIKDIPDSESDMQISSVIIFLAKQLNFTVVAEGVETAEQLSFLRANQCDLAQGFFFSKPIPAHKAMVLLESQRLDVGKQTVLSS